MYYVITSKRLYKGFVSVFFSILVLLSGCKTTIDNSPDIPDEPNPILNLTPLPFSPIHVVQPDELFVLSQQHKDEFLSFYHDPALTDVEGHKRLFNYLENKLSQFHFLGKTYTAQQALDANAGNCLSLAILTTALAGLVGLEVEYQEVNTRPIYSRYDHIMTTSTHVRTLVYAPQHDESNDYITFRRARIIIDYFPDSRDSYGGVVEQSDFLSMYYQNMAGDAIIKRQYDHAYAFIQQALAQNPLNPDTLNTLAVINAKVDHQQNAHAIYQFAVTHTQRSINLVLNYADHLVKQGKKKEAMALLEDINYNADDNPYGWLDTGERFFSEGRYALAKRYYLRAIDTAPYLHEAYWGLAKVHLHNGDADNAREALETAKSLTYEDEQRSLYRAKLLSLK